MRIDSSPPNDHLPIHASPSAEPSRGTKRSADRSFAETALRLGGASADEARRTGAIDTADDQIETLFAPQYQTNQSPVHRAVWDRRVPLDRFYRTGQSPLPAGVKEKIDRCIDVVRQHRAAQTLLDANGKISQRTMDDLGEAGYWGLLVAPQYGGSGFAFRHFTRLITRMASIDPTVAGLASVHGCIGAVDPVRTFGTAEQKSRFLPKLASGERLSAFALTEPCAGSDLTALRTTAVRDGDHYIVTGEKLFITNVLPGRTIGLVCLIDGNPSVLIIDLPDRQDDHFRLKSYGIYALQHAHNYGIIFQDFRVPVENRLDPVIGDGLTIAYHGLNLGRVALCANASGAMRMLLANMLPWAGFRYTYGQSIDRRELVRRRIGHLAGSIVACDAMVDWCSGLLDEGYRGEMECVIAKIFGSESQKEAAIELAMKTHGGRSFLHGHLVGDNIHDFLAPCIYEGEGEMLGMAFFKSLVKQHGKQFFEPIGNTLSEYGIVRPQLWNPLHAWRLRTALWNYGRWYAGRKLSPARWTPLPSMSPPLRRHAEFAQRFLSRAGMEISAVMRRYQLKLVDRQCRISETSQRVQDAVVILCTSLYGAMQSDEQTRIAADVACRHLTRRLTGQRASDADFRIVTQLGASIAEQGWIALDDVPVDAILMPYSRSPRTDETAVP